MGGHLALDRKVDRQSEGMQYGVLGKTCWHTPKSALFQKHQGERKDGNAATLSTLCDLWGKKHLPGRDLQTIASTEPVLSCSVATGLKNIFSCLAVAVPSCWVENL